MPSHEPDKRSIPRARTDLAWERCGLGYAGLAGVVLGVAAHHDAPALLPVALALAAVAAAVWRHGRHAYEAETAVAQPRAAALVTVATVLTGLMAALTVIARL